MNETQNQATPDPTTHDSRLTTHDPLKVVIVSKHDYTGSGWRYMQALKSIGIEARQIKENRRTRIQEPVDIYLPDVIIQAENKQSNYGRSAVDIIKNKALRDNAMKQSLNEVQTLINEADVIIFKGDDLPCDNFLSYLSIPHNKPWIFIAGGSLYRLPGPFFNRKICKGGKIPLSKYREVADWMSGITADLCYDGYFDGYIPHAYPVAESSISFADHGNVINLMSTPSSPEKKGIDMFLEAIEPLKSWIDPMVFPVIIKGVSQEEALKAKSNANLFFDQVGIGWYAFSAVEALSMGIPTIAWIDPKNIPASGMSRKELADIGMYITDKPTVEGLREHISNLIKPKPFQMKLATRSKKAYNFALKYHSYEVIGNKLKDTIEVCINGLYEKKTPKS